MPVVLAKGVYPRAVQVSHGEGSGTILVTLQYGNKGFIYRSGDGGRTFAEWSSIDVAPEGVEVCCVELFEIPRPVGDMAAGTLLWSGSITTVKGPPRQMLLGIWRSGDAGRTWQRLGECAKGLIGLWEPHFLVANDGSLVCLYSDESDQPAHSQIIAASVSHDGGRTFETKRPIVVGTTALSRPGMPTAVQLADSSWLMTYEVCLEAPHCQVHLRRSSDAINWGEATAPGEVPATADGSYFTHTPVVSKAGSGGLNGTLILSGQIYNEADGKVSTGNGHTLLVNQNGGHGPWAAIEAPVPVDSPFDHPCPNYSSPVLPLQDGRLLEVATTWDGTNCTAMYATRRLTA